MASVEEIVQSSGLRNWVKAFIAMRLTKDGLETFVHDDLREYMTNLLQSIYSDYDVKEGTICNSCTTFNILPCLTHDFCRRKSGICQVHDEAIPEKKSLVNCPQGICHHIRAALEYCHRYSRPSWTNTDATQWCTSLNEIAKCFIASGYKDKSDLDLNAIISVIINKKSFGLKMTAQLSSKKADENVCKKVLQMGNKIRHSANLNISEIELKDYINGLVEILSDSKYLARDGNAINAVTQLKMLLTDALIIDKEQINGAFNDATEVLNRNDKNNSGKSFDKEDSTKISDDLEQQVNSPATNDLALEVIKVNISKYASDKAVISSTDTVEIIPEDTSERNVLSAKDAEVQFSDVSNVSSSSDAEGNISKHIPNNEVSSTKNASKKEFSAKNVLDSRLSDNIQNQEISYSKDTNERYSENKALNEADYLTKYTIYSCPRANFGIEEEKKIKLVQIFKEIKDEFVDREGVPISDIDTILAAKLNAIEEIRKTKEENLLELKRQREEIQSEIRLQRGLQFLVRGSSYKELRQDLSTFYRSRYSTISISPLITAHDVQLVDLYVQPKLKYVDVTNTLEGAPADLEIHSYEDLFCCKTSYYKEIYVSAKAGIGKTSFAKKICMTWSQAHFPLKQMENSFCVKDIKTLKKFDFLFMITLKETKAEECYIDAMILNLLENQMKSKGRYRDSFIDDILRNKCVLVILDGLDEWAHPEKCRQKSEVTPHRRPCLKKCSVITTTRPWKLASAKLRNSQINMHAELLEFDEISSRKLIVSAVNLLNKTYKKSKSSENFQKEVSLELLGALRFIPYILLQVICLWYDDLSIGNSQCEIYSNALELTISREGRLDGTRTEKSDTTPKCLSQNITCRTLYTLLVKVGKLAFEALYSCSNESTLLFDEDIVKQYLSEKDLQFVLKKGLLSQNKDSSKVASWKTYFSFQHKSIQEYFAALYIQEYPEDEDVIDKIVQRHNNVESFLEMSNVFIFLGGFHPAVCGRFLQKLKGIFSSDEICNQYRNYLSGRTTSPEKRKCWNIIKSFQKMQIDILQEVSRNGAGECHLYLEDLVLDNSFNMEMLNLLEVIVKENKDNLKSVSIKQCPSIEDIAAKLGMFQLQSSKHLQKLDITAVPPETDLLRLLSNSEKTIVSLDLCFAVYKSSLKIYKTEYTKLSTETMSTVLRMENLQSLRLNSIILPHTEVQILFQYINERKTMTEVGLCHIRCSQHDECVTLDLSQHVNLETLRIGAIPVTLLKLNESCLKFCYTGQLTTAVHTELVQRLPRAVNLKTLRLKFLYGDQSTLYTSGALAKMDQLKSFAIEIADFGQNELIIPPEMSNLERVQFYQVKMTAPILDRFIRNVSKLQQPVLIIIDDCDIVSSFSFPFWTSYDDIKDKVRRMYQKYKVLFDREKTFSFMTRK